MPLQTTCVFLAFQWHESDYNDKWQVACLIIIIEGNNGLTFTFHSTENNYIQGVQQAVPRLLSSSVLQHFLYFKTASRYVCGRSGLTQCARAVLSIYIGRLHGAQIINLFRIKLTNVVIWECFENDQRQFLKKNIFSSKGPPFGFGVFVWQCFGRSWG